MSRNRPMTDSMVWAFLMPEEPRYTLATFLRRELRGTARHYADGYARRMTTRLTELEQVGQVRKCRSLRGGTSWEWVPED